MNNNNKLNIETFSCLQVFFYWKTLTWLFLHQFWLIYSNIKSTQHMLLVTAVQHNDVELRLESIKCYLPLFFDYIMQNFARSGSFYTELLSSLKANYTGLRSQLSKTGLSIQV